MKKRAGAKRKKSENLNSALFLSDLTEIAHLEGKARMQNVQVAQGMHSYVRYPQYCGLFLITIGFLIQWSTLTTLVMWPILMFAYYKLAMREEKDLEKQFGKEFLDYKKKVPAFTPKGK